MNLRIFDLSRSSNSVVGSSSSKTSGSLKIDRAIEALFI